MYSVSVAMATYNGEKYIKEQIESILVNLKESDELVISDDCSSDNTIKIIKAFNDSRIKIVKGPKLGVKKNFENAIKNTKNEIIFLADQDDIWDKNKVKIVLKNFDDSTNLVIHDAIVVDKNLKKIENSFYKLRNSKKGFIKNLYKNSYIGCCMAFRRNYLDKILPIPNNIEMHDQWIGLKIKQKNVKFINNKLIKYRRHDNNVSELIHHSVFIMIKNRFNFIKEYIK